MEVAKAERERLKQHQQHKKQLVEKMRAEQNAMAEAGEVCVCVGIVLGVSGRLGWFVFGV